MLFFVVCLNVYSSVWPILLNFSAKYYFANFSKIPATNRRLFSYVEHDDFTKNYQASSYRTLIYWIGLTCVERQSIKPIMFNLSLTILEHTCKYKKTTKILLWNSNLIVIYVCLDWATDARYFTSIYSVGTLNWVWVTSFTLT